MSTQSFNKKSNLFGEIVKRILLEGHNKDLALSFVGKLRPGENKDSIISGILATCPAAKLSNNKWLPAICKLHLQDNIETTKLDKLFTLVDKYQNSPTISKLNITGNYKNIDYSTVEKALDSYTAKASEKEAKKKQVNQASTVNNYKIIPLLTFEDAKKYKDLASWCICTNKDRFNGLTYTEHGKDKWYLLINQNTVNKYNHSDQEAGKYVNQTEREEYAYSAIIVNIDPDGNLHYGVTRYNDGNTQISGYKLNELLGRNFRTILKPFTKEDKLKIEEEKEKVFELAQKKLDSGDNPEDVFDRVSHGEEFSVISLDGKWNFINSKHRIISKQWFDDADKFYGKAAVVELNGKENLLNTGGNLVSKQWFDRVTILNEDSDFARVVENFKWNFIDLKGNILSKQWFDAAEPFYHGIAKVSLNRGWNLLNSQGELLFSKEFDFIYGFHGGFFKVEVNKKINYLDREGNIISKQWFDSGADFHEGFATVVVVDHKQGVLNKEGTLVAKGFDYVGFWHNGFAEVRMNDGTNPTNDKFNFINTEGKLISDTWFSWVGYFQEGYAPVERDFRGHKKRNFIDEKGQLLLDKWPEWVSPFVNGFAQVSNGHAYNFVNKKGKLISNTWFEEAGNFILRKDSMLTASVTIGDDYYYINTSGDIVYGDY